MSRRRQLTTIALTGVLLTSACSLVLGLRDGTLDFGDGGSDASSDLNPLRDVISIGDANFGNCGDAGRVDDPDVVHVDQGSSAAADIGGCGSVAQPCKSVSYGITEARSHTRRQVVVAPGTYTENIALSPLDNGLVVEGGWSPSWIADCNTSLARIVGVTANEDATLAIAGASNITVRLLTIESRAQGNAGETVYAARVENPVGAITFDNVVLIAQNGGDGLPGSPASPTGNGCATGSGANGDAGAPGPLGAFAVSGYQPASGGGGSVGQPGLAGGSGGPGQTGGSCVVCSMVIGVVDAGDPDAEPDEAGPTCVSATPLVPPNGGAGTPGCGGQPGSGGTGGRGAGGSIALYAIGTDASVVTLRGGALVTNSGGTGGPGGSGGLGAAGEAGASGSTAQCATTCWPAPANAACQQNVCNQTCVTLTGGSAGSAGGKGGKGGTGGGGFGGPTYLIVNGNQIVNVATSPAPELTLGSGGAGGAPNGIKGEAAETHTP